MDTSPATIELLRLSRACAELQRQPGAVLAALAALGMAPAEMRDEVLFLTREQVERLRAHFAGDADADPDD